MNDFERFDETLLTQIGTVLYKVLMKQPGKITYCLPSTTQDPYRLFEEFCEAFPERSGFICQQMFPSAIQSYYADDGCYSEDTENCGSDSDLYYHSESCFESSDSVYYGSQYNGSECYDSGSKSSEDSTTSESEERLDTKNSEEPEPADKPKFIRISQMPEAKVEYDLLINKRRILTFQPDEKERKVFPESEAPAELDWEVI